MTTPARQETSGLFKTYTSFGADIDVTIDYPGYTAMKGPRYPREVVYSGGNLVVQLDDGTNITLNSAFAGIPRARSFQKIISSGTTATAAEVAW
jgi:hypothetical protein